MKATACGSKSRVALDARPVFAQVTTLSAGEVPRRSMIRFNWPRSCSPPSPQHRVVAGRILTGQEATPPSRNARVGVGYIVTTSNCQKPTQVLLLYTYILH